MCWYMSPLYLRIKTAKLSNIELNIKKKDHKLQLISDVNQTITTYLCLSCCVEGQNYSSQRLALFNIYQVPTKELRTDLRGIKSFNCHCKK